MIRKTFVCTILFCSLFTSACNQRPGSGQQTGTDSLFQGPLFEMNVRPTEALSPEEEQKGLLLPEGFEISLFASEPDIGKPMNITWDAKGRMWVTQSFE